MIYTPLFSLDIIFCEEKALERKNLGKKSRNYFLAKKQFHTRAWEEPFSSV